jgi:hypothetical protein
VTSYYGEVRMLIRLKGDGVGGRINTKKKPQKTYNIRDSRVVTDPTWNYWLTLTQLCFGREGSKSKAFRDPNTGASSSLTGCC